MSASQVIPLRPTHVEVDLAALAANLHAIQAHVGRSRVMPVVKANAYGHGLVPVAQRMQAEGASILAVAILDEGLVLRQAGIHADILVMGGIHPHQIPAYLQNNLILTVTSQENLEWIAAAARQLGLPARIHIKIDTGMGRLGVHYDQAESVLQASLGLEQVRVEGIYSHFANSDAADLSHAHIQLARFNQVLAFYQRHGLPRPLTHMANSGGILQLPESHFDLVRPGIMLYGVYPSPECARTVAIRPALTWRTQPVHVKLLPAGHPVSYGSTWQSDHPTRILTLPVGYGDGYFRLHSNRARVLLRGKAYPQVGRVCMDQMLANLENDPASSADVVTLLGEDGAERITCEELAVLAQTIPYEILTNISARVPRIYRG